MTLSCGCVCDESKTPHCKGQYCIRMWSVRSKQGKLDMAKQKMLRINTDILGISELTWTGMGEFNSDDHCIYYCGQESHRSSRVVFIINKRVEIQYLAAAPQKTE